MVLELKPLEKNFLMVKLEATLISEALRIIILELIVMLERWRTTTFD